MNNNDTKSIAPPPPVLGGIVATGNIMTTATLLGAAPQLQLVIVIEVQIRTVKCGRTTRTAR